MEEELPEHIVFLILLWLPVKSLLRFKAVCKYWYDLIQSSTFINQHLLHQQENINCSIISRKCNVSKSGYFKGWSSPFFMVTGDKFDQPAIRLDFADEEFRRYNIDSPFLVSQLYVGNTCNGIISLHFLQSGLEDVALWNPATKQLRPLPLPQFPVSRSRPPQQHIIARPILGFDIKTNDYKVVKIIQSIQSDKDFDALSQVEVYNLSTDTWRILHTDYLLPFDNICFTHINVVYKNGICFWCGARSTLSKWSSHWVLVSFEFSTDTFRFMPMPNTSRGDTTFALDFFDDNLICFNGLISFPDTHQHFDIWMLHGYNTNESWTKLYTIGPFDGGRPHKFLKNREFLLVSKSYRIFLYNQVTQKMQKFHYRDPDPIPMLAIFNESLVSIKGENDAANRKASLLQFGKICGYGFAEIDEEDVTDEERVESQSEEESQEDRETKHLENRISNLLDLGLKLGSKLLKWIAFIMVIMVCRLWGAPLSNSIPTDP